MNNDLSEPLLAAEDGRAERQRVKPKKKWPSRAHYSPQL